MNKIKEKWSNLLPKNSFIRSVSVLVGGTATAQVIAILATPFFTRLYSVEAFGVLAVFTSIVGMVSVVASLMGNEQNYSMKDIFSNQSEAA